MAERNVMPEYRATERPAGKPAQAFPYWRTLKVHRSHASSRFTPHQGFKPAPPVVPRVLLRGQWLSEAGFDTDTLLDVEVSEGRIVLTAVVN